MVSPRTTNGPPLQSSYFANHSSSRMEDEMANIALESLSPPPRPRQVPPTPSAQRNRLSGGSIVSGTGDGLKYPHKETSTGVTDTRIGLKSTTELKNSAEGRTDTAERTYSTSAGRGGSLATISASSAAAYAKKLEMEREEERRRWESRKAQFGDGGNASHDEGGAYGTLNETKSTGGYDPIAKGRERERERRTRELYNRPSSLRGSQGGERGAGAGTTEGGRKEDNGSKKNRRITFDDQQYALTPQNDRLSASLSRVSSDTHADPDTAPQLRGWGGRSLDHDAHGEEHELSEGDLNSSGALDVREKEMLKIEHASSPSQINWELLAKTPPRPKGRTDSDVEADIRMLEAILETRTQERDLSEDVRDLEEKMKKVGINTSVRDDSGVEHREPQSAHSPQGYSHESSRSPVSSRYYVLGEEKSVRGRGSLPPEPTQLISAPKEWVPSKSLSPPPVSDRRGHSLESQDQQYDRQLAQVRDRKEAKMEELRLLREHEQRIRTWGDELDDRNRRPLTHSDLGERPSSDTVPVSTAGSGAAPVTSPPVRSDTTSILAELEKKRREIAELTEKVSVPLTTANDQDDPVRSSREGEIQPESPTKSALGDDRPSSSLPLLATAASPPPPPPLAGVDIQPDNGQSHLHPKLPHTPHKPTTESADLTATSPTRTHQSMEPPRTHQSMEPPRTHQSMEPPRTHQSMEPPRNESEAKDPAKLDRRVSIELGKMEMRIRTLEDENWTLQNQLSESKEHLQSAKDHEDTMTERVAEMEEKNDELRIAADVLQHEKQEIQANYEELVVEMKDIEATNKALKEEIEHLRGEKLELAKELELTERELVTTREGSCKAEADHTRKVADMQRQLRDAEQEKARTERAVNSAVRLLERRKTLSTPWDDWKSSWMMSQWRRAAITQLSDRFFQESDKQLLKKTFLNWRVRGLSRTTARTGLMSEVFGAWKGTEKLEKLESKVRTLKHFRSTYRPAMKRTLDKAVRRKILRAAFGGLQKAVRMENRVREMSFYCWTRPLVQRRLGLHFHLWRSTSTKPANLPERDVLRRDALKVCVRNVKRRALLAKGFSGFSFARKLSQFRKQTKTDEEDLQEMFQQRLLDERSGYAARQRQVRLSFQRLSAEFTTMTRGFDSIERDVQEGLDQATRSGLLEEYHTLHKVKATLSGTRHRLQDFFEEVERTVK